MNSSAESYSRSLWWNVTAEPRVERPPLSGPEEADVLIVGGGFTGMASALFLAQAGQKVVVLEARHVGFGASGRNGGQVIPGLKHDPEELLAEHGAEEGGRLVRMVGGAADLVFETIAAHGIRCAPVRGGWIQAAHSPIALRAVLERARQWQAQGVPVEILDRAQIAARSGTGVYFGGWCDPRAGALQPLDYVRGLARAAAEQGAVIHENSVVTGLARDGADWVATTAGGRVRARRALVATNGYTGGLVPGLAQSILPVQSMIIATRPLPEALRRSILPGGTVLSETRKLAFYMRQDAEGRFVIGGRGAVGAEEKPALMQALREGMARMFPQIGAIDIEFHWSGHIAMSMDGMPHVHAPAPGLNAMLAYNGRGVAMATTFGKMYAEHVVEGRPMTFPTTPIRPLPWHALRKPVMDLGIRWYWLKDRLGLASK